MSLMSSTCANCNSSDLMSIELTLADGPMRFVHCRDCEHRWWIDLDDAQNLALRDVLERAAA